MKQYHDLVSDVLENGTSSDDRTGTGTISVFGRQARYDLSKGFPLLTTKRTFWKGVLVELIWLMRGETNVKFLQERGVTIWDEWADENGDLGPVYGEQWRNWKYYEELSVSNSGIVVDGTENTMDQLKWVIQRIKTNPNCRRLIVSAWNAPMISQMKLPPCHTLFQFYVRNGKLSCHLYQRSADVFLGVPFNIASYACLTHLVANECGLEVGEFIHTFGDLHLYKNHLDQARELLTRSEFPLPQLEINIPKGQLMDWIDNKVQNQSWEEIQQMVTLKNYQSHPAIKAEVSV
jgi:thymidylate synthase